MQTSINELLNSTELLHYPVCIWGSDISFQDLLDDEDLKESIANDTLDDEQQELLAFARARCGPDISEFENAVNSLWSVSSNVMAARRRLCEMKIDHPNLTTVPPTEIVNATTWLQALGRSGPLPLAGLEQCMHEFCARQQTISYTEQEKSAATIIQKVESALENKHKAVEKLLDKEDLLKEKLVLCIGKQATSDVEPSANMKYYSFVQFPRCEVIECGRRSLCL